MRVDLRTLHPNPMRDFRIDPIDPAIVAVLKQSIEEDGFWGGIVCRKLADGAIQVGAGHHRVAAAIDAGVTTVDIFVAEEMDDSTMIRVYARENATQRGHTSTALAGTVASAVRFLTKGVLTNTLTQKFLREANLNLERLRGHIESREGIGHMAVLAFLKGIPGINSGSVQQQLANLKASGDYSRIIQEVQAEIEQENQEAFAALAAEEEQRRQREQERVEAEERQREAERARQEAQERQREAARARKEAEHQQREAERARQEAESREKAAQAETERARQADLRAKAEAERARQAEAARRAEAEQRRQAEVEQEAEAAREKAEAEAALAEKRRQEADVVLEGFAELRQTRDTSRAATAKAKEQPTIFDFEGVAHHLKNPYQIDVFREIATTPEVQRLLAYEDQAAFALHLKTAAENQPKGRKELSGKFIELNFTEELARAKLAGRQWQREEQAASQQDPALALEKAMQDFARRMRGLTTAGQTIAKLLSQWPATREEPRITHEFRSDLKDAHGILTSLMRDRRFRDE